MTDIDSEEARAERRQLILLIRPAAANALMPRAEFYRLYKQPYVLQDCNLRSTEQSNHTWFCPACPEAMAHGLSKRFRLYVVYEEDPLRNFSALVTVQCHHCGWNEILPVPHPEQVSSEQSAKAAPVTDVWSDKIIDAYKNKVSMKYYEGAPLSVLETAIWHEYDQARVRADQYAKHASLLRRQQHAQAAQSRRLAQYVESAQAAALRQGTAAQETDYLRSVGADKPAAPNWRARVRDMASWIWGHVSGSDHY